MPKISVIIPVYNVEQYLRECLDSVVNQTLKDIEIICVNDCTQDNSMSIVREYAQKDSRIKIVEHRENKGLGSARNTGMDVVTGDYIFFLDSDDYLKTDILEHLYKKAMDTNADVVFSQAIAFTEMKDKYTLNRIQEMNKWLDCSELKDYYIDTDNFMHSITKVNCVAWGKLYSADFLKRNAIRFVDGKIIHEDNGFWLKICSNFPYIAFIPNIGVMYRIRENAITTEIDKKKNRNKKHKHIKIVLKDVFEYFSNCKNKAFYEFFVAQTKNSCCYSDEFSINLGLVFQFKWLRNDKKITILGIPIFREKQKSWNSKNGRILGIRIYKSKIQPIYPLRNIIKENRISKFLDTKYVFPFLENKLEKYQIVPKKNLNTDKIIWQFWAQGIETAPNIVKVCFNSVDKYKGEYTVIRLTEESIQEYIDLPDFVIEKFKNKQFGYAHFSDLLRVCLLSAYGGIWIDATILLTDHIKQEYLEQDFFSFQRTKRPKDYKMWEEYNKDYFVFDKNFKVKWLNSFVIAKNGNCIVNALKDIILKFWENENCMEEYFTMQYMFDTLVKYEPYKSSNKLKVSDLPPHLMQKNFYEKYTNILWDSMLEQSCIHKLTYATEDGRNNILKHILRGEE